MIENFYTRLQYIRPKFYVHLIFFFNMGIFFNIGNRAFFTSGIWPDSGFYLSYILLDTIYRYWKNQISG
jgi:hypothetical protein